MEKSRLAAIRSEVAMIESSGRRGRDPELVYRKSTERAFSAAGVLGLCTKVQSRLSDSLLTRCVYCPRTVVVERTD